MWDITDFDEIYIQVDNGWQTFLVPKFRIVLDPVVEPYCTIKYTNTEENPVGLQRQIVFDFNTTDLGGVPSSSAAEIYATINNYIRSAFGGISGGDVVGPASSVDDNIAVFDGITGKLIKDGGVKVSNLMTQPQVLARTMGS